MKNNDSKFNQKPLIDSNTMNRIYFLLFVFLCFTSCDEKHKYELYPSNERYISVSTFNDSIILDYQDSCDTLIKVGSELYDIKGNLFFTTKKDTLLFLDSIEKGLKRSINHVKGKKEYISSTYKGSWIDKSRLFTVTFDEKGNILKIFRPFYIIDYIADRNNVQPIKQNTRHRKFYYPKADELWHYEFIYDEKNILMRISQKMKFDTLYYKGGEIYDQEDGLLLSTKKDTTITKCFSSDVIEIWPHRICIHSVNKSKGEYSSIISNKIDTSFKFFAEYLYDENYRIKKIRQSSVAEFVQSKGL